MALPSCGNSRTISPAQLDDGKPLLIPDVNKVERSVHDKKERREENFSLSKSLSLSFEDRDAWHFIPSV